LRIVFIRILSLLLGLIPEVVMVVGARRMWKRRVPLVAGTFVNVMEKYPHLAGKFKVDELL